MSRVVTALQTLPELRGILFCCASEAGAPTHHRKAERMPLNFAGPMGGVDLLAPEGFMGARSQNYQFNEVGKVPCRTTFKSMDTMPLLQIEKPRRINRPELERFFTELLRQQENLALMFWEYICRNDNWRDGIEEAIQELRRRK